MSAFPASFHRSRMSYCKRISLSLILVLTSALPAVASTVDEWHALMQSGSKAANGLDFDRAKQFFSQASLTAGDARILSLLALGRTCEESGDYAAAEKAYKQALTEPDSEDVRLVLIDVLQKSSCCAEAEEQLKLAVVVTPNLFAAMKSCMPYVQSAVRTTWKAAMSQSKVKTFEPKSRWTRVFIRLNPNAQHPVAYVVDSSGDTVVDKASIEAAEMLDMQPIASKLKFPTMINFLFEYNEYTSTEQVNTRSSLTPACEEQYRECQDLVAWQQSHLGPSHPQVAETLVEAADILAQAGQNKQAETVLATAVDILQRDNKPRGFRIYKRYGDTLLKNKGYQQAAAILTRAFELASIESRPESMDFLETRNTLMTALKKAGRGDEASKLRDKH